MPVPEEEHRILLVDDNPFNLLVAETLLKEKGFKVVTAYNGKEALEKADRYKDFRLIIIDCQMPILDGIEATKHLKKRMIEGEIEAAPIIGLSANNLESERKKGLKAGMDEFIVKPLTENAVDKILKRYGLHEL